MTTYRPITESDIEILLSMMQDFYAIDGYPIDVEKSKALFQEFIVNDFLGKSWIIESEGKIAGYVILAFIFSFEFGGRIAFLDELYIKDEFRGKGIGKQSIDFIQQKAVEHDLKLLYLEVEHHNSAAKKLYLNKGFASHKRELLTYRIT